MIHHEVTQGSDAWRALRIGRPTASEIHRILTPGKLALAKGRTSYQIELLTERILGMPLDGPTTPAMLHGTDFEATAVAAYEFEQGVDTQACGFCTTDDGRVGASPDRFVGDVGSLEVKSPFKPQVHVGYMLDNSALVAEYMIQVQSQLYVSGREWTDLISYFGGMPMVCVRILPDPKIQEALKGALAVFLEELDAMEILARQRGWIPEPEAPADHSGDFVSDEDVEMILAAQRKARGE